MSIPARLSNREKFTAQALLDFCVRWDWVSFAELKRRFAICGNCSFEFEGLNIIIWFGLSREFVETLFPLIDSGKLVIVTGSALSYLVDGGILKLPIAKSVRRYAKPRWAPCFIRLLERVRDLKKRKSIRLVGRICE